MLNAEPDFYQEISITILPYFCAVFEMAASELSPSSIGGIKKNLVKITDNEF